MDKIDVSNQVYYHRRNGRWPGIILSLLFGSILIIGCYQPANSNERGYFVAGILMLGCVEILFVRLTVMAFTSTLTLAPDGITEKSLFGSRYVAFAEITSLQSSTFRWRGSANEITTIKGLGGAIVLASQMSDDYKAIMAYIRSHAPGG